MWREREGGRERKKYGSKRHTRCQRGTVCPLFTGVTAGWNCHCLKICLHRGLKYTVGIRPNDDRSPSFFHLLSPRERHCSASMEPKEGEGETSSRSCFNFVPMCRWRNVCVLSLWRFTRLPPPPHEKWKEIFPHCTSRNRYRDNSDVIDRGELRERIGHWLLGALIIRKWGWKFCFCWRGETWTIRIDAIREKIAKELWGIGGDSRRENK